MPEQKWIVDLAGTGLVAAGIVGELDMGDARQMRLQAPRDIALHDLHVIDVVLDEQIARSHAGDEFNRLLRPVQVEARDVAGPNGSGHGGSGSGAAEAEFNAQKAMILG